MNSNKQDLQEMENEIRAMEMRSRFNPLMSLFNAVSFMIQDFRKIGLRSGKAERGKVIYSGRKPYTPLKIGRNDLCPCDSNQKFKKCHGKRAT